MGCVEKAKWLNLCLDVNEGNFSNQTWTKNPSFLQKKKPFKNKSKFAQL